MMDRGDRDPGRWSWLSVHSHSSLQLAQESLAVNPKVTEKHSRPFQNENVLFFLEPVGKCQFLWERVGGEHRGGVLVDRVCQDGEREGRLGTG